MGNQLRARLTSGDLDRLNAAMRDPMNWYPTEWDGQDIRALIREVRASREALIAAAIPLEALNMDNSNGAKWMAPSVKQHVAEAVTAIREALRITEGGSSSKAG